MTCALRRSSALRFAYVWEEPEDVQRASLAAGRYRREDVLDVRLEVPRGRFKSVPVLARVARIVLGAVRGQPVNSTQIGHRDGDEARG